MADGGADKVRPARAPQRRRTVCPATRPPERLTPPVHLDEATREALATVSAERARRIGADIGAEQAQRYEACLEEVAMSSSEIKMQHRLATRRGMNVAMDLLREIELAALAKSQIEEELARCQIDDPARAVLIDKLLGLRGRVDTVDKWATALSKIADAERRANDMDAESKASDVDALLLRIHADKQAQGQASPRDGS